MMLEAFTFEEFIDCGRKCVGDNSNGMPDGFDFLGYRATHETDSIYTLTSQTEEHLLFTTETVAIIENGYVSLVSKSQFEQMCEPTI